MATCKVCGKQYHACGSCGLANWEHDYCGFRCYDLGSADVRKDMDEFLDCLSPETRKRLFYFIDEWEELFWTKLEEAADGSE